MPLRKGRMPAHMGSFGQAQDSIWAKHAGVLADEEFLAGAKAGRREFRASQGKALMARSLARTKAGYKHKGGDTAKDEEMSELRKTVEAQNEKILDLEGRLPTEPEITAPGGPAPEMVSGIDEGHFETPE